MKLLIANVMPEETRVAVVEDDILCDYAIERDDEKHIVNHIYKGVIKNILPAMQAAFVDIGRKKNAFLYLGDIFPRAATKEEIQQMHISVGQSFLVQVVKEEIGTKGPKVTANVSIAGRYVVLMPQVDYIGVSKKISDEGERKRLRGIADAIKPKGMGLIIRTVARGIDRDELIHDIHYLFKTWEGVQRRYTLSKKPALLYREADLVMRMIRDYFTFDVDKVVVDDQDAYERICQVFSEDDQTWRGRVERYAGKQPVFERYHLEEQLHTLMERQVTLPSGGTLVFDHTEALTVIDVNSGSYTGHSTLQDTIFHVNKEAAIEIARQLRLRDIGGIIIIDFIDMVQPFQRDEILKLLEREVRSDRTTTHILGMTALNLVEITRKKSRQGIHQVLFSPCNVCGGSGTLYSPETVSVQIMRRLRELIFGRHIKGDVLISAHADVLCILQNKQRKEAMEREFSRTIHFEQSTHPNREVFSILSYEE